MYLYTPPSSAHKELKLKKIVFHYFIHQSCILQQGKKCARFPTIVAGCLLSSHPH